MGRDYDEIAKTISGEVFRVSGDRARDPSTSARARCGAQPARSRGERETSSARPEQVMEKIQTYLDLGCTGFVPWCSDCPDDQSPGTRCRKGDSELPLSGYTWCMGNLAADSAVEQVEEIGIKLHSTGTGRSGASMGRLYRQLRCQGSRGRPRSRRSGQSSRASTC